MYKTENILSWDCANRSLAVVYVSINTNWDNDMLKWCNLVMQEKGESIETLNRLISQGMDIAKSYAKIHFARSFDVLENVKIKDPSCEKKSKNKRTLKRKEGTKIKTSEVDCVTRALALHQHLCQVDSLIRSTGINLDRVFIEYQMNINKKSGTVCDQLVGYYCSRAQVKIIPPSWKQKVWFGDLNIQYFLENSTRSYNANKAHSKANFVHWCEISRQNRILKGLNSRHLSDIGDAFMQILGWFEFGQYSLLKSKKPVYIVQSIESTTYLTSGEFKEYNPSLQRIN